MAVKYTGYNFFLFHGISLANIVSFLFLEVSSDYLLPPAVDTTGLVENSRIFCRKGFQDEKKMFQREYRVTKNMALSVLKL